MATGLDSIHKETRVRRQLEIVTWSYHIARWLLLKLFRKRQQRIFVFCVNHLVKSVLIYTSKVSKCNHHSINKSFNQLIGPSVSQIISQSFEQVQNQPMNQPIKHQGSCCGVWIKLYRFSSRGGHFNNFLRWGRKPHESQGTWSTTNEFVLYLLKSEIIGGLPLQPPGFLLLFSGNL